MSISSIHISVTLSQHPFLSCPPSCLVTMRSTAMALLWCFASQVPVRPLLLPLKAVGHGYLGTCCGGMCPQRAPCPVTVSSYLCNPEQVLSAQLQPISARPWISLGVAISPVPAHPGNWKESKGAGHLPCAVRMCSLNTLWDCFLEVDCNNRGRQEKTLVNLGKANVISQNFVDSCTISYPALASIPQQTYISSNDTIMVLTVFVSLSSHFGNVVIYLFQIQPTILHAAWPRLSHCLSFWISNGSNFPPDGTEKWQAACRRGWSQTCCLQRESY